MSWNPNFKLIKLLLNDSIMSFERRDRLRRPNDAIPSIPTRRGTSLRPSLVANCCRFDPNRISPVELRDYLAFCRKYFPNNDNSLGLIFSEPLNEEKALHLLHANDYNLTKTKFLILFPALARTIEKKNLNIRLSNEDMERAVSEHINHSHFSCSQQEADFIKKLRMRFGHRGNQPLVEVEAEIARAVQLGYGVPSGIKAEAEAARAIENEVLRALKTSINPKALKDIEARAAMSMFRLPSIDRLREHLAPATQLEERVMRLMNMPEKTMGMIKELALEAKNLNIKTQPHTNMQAFAQLAMECNNINEDINCILSAEPSIRQKVPRSKADEVFLFYERNNIEKNKDYHDLQTYVNFTDQFREQLCLYLEDPVELPNSKFSEAIQKINFDYENILQRLESRNDLFKKIAYLEANCERIELVRKNEEIFKRAIESRFPIKFDSIKRIKETIERLKSFDDIRKWLTEQPTILQLKSFLMGQMKLVEISKLKLFIPNGPLEPGSIWEETKNFIDDFENDVQIEFDAVKTKSTSELADVLEQKLLQYYLINPSLSILQKTLNFRLTEEVMACDFLRRFSDIRVPLTRDYAIDLIKPTINAWTINDGLEIFALPRLQHSPEIRSGITILSERLTTLSRQLDENPTDPKDLLEIYQKIEKSCRSSELMCRVRRMLADCMLGLLKLAFANQKNIRDRISKLTITEEVMFISLSTADLKNVVQRAKNRRVMFPELIIEDILFCTDDRELRNYIISLKKELSSNCRTPIALAELVMALACTAEAGVDVDEFDQALNKANRFFICFESQGQMKGPSDLLNCLQIFQKPQAIAQKSGDLAVVNNMHSVFEETLSKLGFKSVQVKKTKVSNSNEEIQGSDKEEFPELEVQTMLVKRDVEDKDVFIHRDAQDERMPNKFIQQIYGENNEKRFIPAPAQLSFDANWTLPSDRIPKGGFDLSSFGAENGSSAMSVFNALYSFLEVAPNRKLRTFLLKKQSEDIFNELHRCYLHLCERLTSPSLDYFSTTLRRIVKLILKLKGLKNYAVFCSASQMRLKIVSCIEMYLNIPFTFEPIENFFSKIPQHFALIIKSGTN